MNLYYMSAAILVLAAVLAILVFVSYRKRLVTIQADTELTLDGVKTVFTSTSLERVMGYVLIAAIVLMVWQTIKQGFDFALLMIGAMFFTGVVWAVDRIITRQARLSVLNRAESEIKEFDEQVNKSVLEPGLIENSRAFFPILIVVFILRSFIIEPFQIPSGSMKPTLEIRDFILVSRFAYGLRMPITNQVIVPIANPKRGDVIVFKPPHEPQSNFIKRVIAVPGDRIQYDYKQKILRVNGQIVQKKFDKMVVDGGSRFGEYTEDLYGHEHLMYKKEGSESLMSYAWLPKEGVIVPKGKYFVMGDNRDNSLDARYWEGIREFNNIPNTTGEPYPWGFVDENSIMGKAFAIWMHWEGFYPSFSRTGAIQ